MAKSHILFQSNSLNAVEVRSYKTQAALDLALTRLGFITHYHAKCLTTDGRWTAIFTSSNFINGGYVCLYSSQGFLTV